MTSCINFNFSGNAEKAKSLSKEFDNLLSPKQIGGLWNEWINEDPTNISKEPTKEALAEVYGRLSNTSREELLNNEDIQDKTDVIDALQSLFFMGIEDLSGTVIITRKEILQHSVSVLDQLPEILKENGLGIIADNYSIYRKYLEQTRLRKYNVVTEETDYEEKAVKDGIAAVSSVFFDNKGRASDEVVYLFAALTNPDDLVYGIERPLPFDSTWNIIQNNLSNSLSFDDQVQTLLSLKDRHPFIGTLLQKMGIAEDGSSLPGYESLRVSFGESFTKQASDISITKVGGKDTYSSIDSQTKMSLITQAKTKFRKSKYSTKVLGRFVLNTKEYKALNLGNTDEDYKTFMSIFGLDLKAPLTPETRGHIKQIKNQLELKLDENIIWLDDRALDVEGRLGNILDEEIPYEQENKNLSTPNAEGKQQYSVHNHNYISRLYSKLKKGLSKPSIPLSKLIATGKVKLEILSGLEDINKKEASTFADLDVADIYSAMFNDMFSNNPIVHLPRTADKSMERGFKIDTSLDQDLAQTTITPALWKNLYNLFKQDATTPLHPKWNYGAKNALAFWKEVADLDPTDSEAVAIQKLRQNVINNTHFALKTKLEELGVFYMQNDKLETSITNAILDKMGWKNATDTRRKEIFGQLVDNFNFNSFYYAVQNTIMTQGSMVGVKANNFYKRASGPVAEGRQVATHQSFLDEITRDYKKYNLPYEASKIKVMVHEETFDESSKALIRQSPAYKENNVDDGQGIVTLPVYRTILKGAGQWNDRQQEAYDLLMEGKKLPKYLKGVLQPIKPVGYSLLDIDGSKVPVFLKMAIYPISPSSIGTANYKKWELSMANGVSLFIPKSSIKMASPDNLKPILDKEGNIIDNPSATFDFPLEDFRVQLDINAKLTSDQLQGTQQRKLLYTNLFEGGNAKDPKYKEWLDENIATLEGLAEIERQGLYKRAGIVVENGTPAFQDYNKLKEVLQDELLSKDLPINTIESINQIIKDGNLVGKIDSLPSRQKIMNLLNSIITNNLINLYTNGSALVQISQQGWELNKIADPTSENILAIKTNLSFVNDAAKIAYYKNNGLAFFTLGKNTGAAECILPAKYKKFTKKDAEGNTIIDDERVLVNIGYRIPTQSHNSILHLRVVGFLPEELSQMIILPKEITTQGGADFDVDKINMFIPNTITLDGKVQYISSEMDPEEIWKLNDYDKLVKEVGAEGAKILTKMFSAAVDKDIYNLEETEPEAIKSKEDWIEKFRKQQLQNQLIEQTVRILEDPIVRDSLLNPNGPGDLKESSKENREYLESKGIQPKMLQVTMKNMFHGKTLLDIVYQMFASKALVGVFASQATHHALAQQVGLKMVSKRLLFFDHNRDEEGNTDLSKEKGVTGYTISDRIGNNYLSAAVDAAKDDYLTDLGVNLQTGSLVAFYERAGGDPKMLYRWLTHPKIQQYLSEKAKNNSIVAKTTGQKKSNKSIIEKLLNKKTSQYFQEKWGNEGDAKLLYEARKERGDLTINKINNDDVDILEDFLWLEEAAMQLTKGISISKFDTEGPGKDIIGSYQKKIEFDNFINKSNVDGTYSLVTKGGSYLNLITDTVLNVFYKNSFDFTLDLYQPLTVLMDRNVKTLLRSMLFNSDFVSKKASEYEGNLIYGGIINFIIQNNAGFNSSLFMGDKSLANQILKIQQNASHPLHDNNIIKHFFNIELGADNKTPDLMIPVNKRMSSNESDQATIDFEEIKELSPELYNNLLIASLFQTGVAQSPSSFYSQLPSKDMIPKVNELLVDINIDRKNIKEAAVSLVANLGKKLSNIKYVKARVLATEAGVKLTSKETDGKDIVYLNTGSASSGYYYRLGQSEFFKLVPNNGFKSLFYNYVLDEAIEQNEEEEGFTDDETSEDNSEPVETKGNAWSVVEPSTKEKLEKVGITENLFNNLSEEEKSNLIKCHG